MPFRVSKKWLNATFLSFTGFAYRIRSRAAKSAKYENLWVFIRSDAHVVRAGLNIRGCGPLSTPGFFDRLRRMERLFILRKCQSALSSLWRMPSRRNSSDMPHTPARPTSV